MAAMTAAPIIPAPTLKPLPALVVAVAGAEDEALEAADEAEVLAGALDDATVVAAVVEDAAVVAADDATDDPLAATEPADETAEDAADAALDAWDDAVLEAPFARAMEQI